MVNAVRDDDENSGPTNADNASRGKGSAVPLGVAVDDRPTRKPSRAATNDREDRIRALMLIGAILSGVLLMVVLGSTVLRPLISNQRQLTLVRITSEQVELLAEIAEEHYQTYGVIPTAVSELLKDERLETTDGRDLWGTGFVLHTEQLESGGGTQLFVTSAGPDKEFGTDDDLVADRVLGVPSQSSVD